MQWLYYDKATHFYKKEFYAIALTLSDSVPELDCLPQSSVRFYPVKITYTRRGRLVKHVWLKTQDYRGRPGFPRRAKKCLNL